MLKPDQQRYHLALTIDGRPAMHSWIGEYGSVTGARITLTDQADDRELAAWP